MTVAEALLRKLGITDPSEIDVEAIAWTQGVKVNYRVLDGCEARIVGRDDRAIITVNSRSSARRQRFSIAHELGHWAHHRGQFLICRPDDIGQGEVAMKHRERVANGHAAELLMPKYLFREAAGSYKQLTFQAAEELGNLFDTSRSATAMRLVELRHSPAILVCHGPAGRKWFKRSMDVPERWFPRIELDADSLAFDVLFGNATEDHKPRKSSAGVWFDRRGADRYELFEQTIRTGPDEALTLLLIEDEEMLEEEGGGRGFRARCR